ncbi:MAG: zinc ribbon domain-containing protein [Clostridia bacterium]|nr:zinc ribbon domain-containing protein [Clostridia bacterium]
MKRWTSLLLAFALLCLTTSALADWTCACGATNDGKFCTECGTAMPADDTWTCACGKTNTSKFCSSCGRAKDAANTCVACGYKPEDGGAFKFCPKCGAASGDSAPAATDAPEQSGTLRITGAWGNGDGSTTIAWEGGSAPYTLYYEGYSNSYGEVVASDIYDTTFTTYHLEPYAPYVLRVGDADSTSKAYRYVSGETWTSYHDVTGLYITPLLTLKVTHNGQTEQVKNFSRSEIEAAKAANPDGWFFDYTADVHFSYNYDQERVLDLQMYVDSPSLRLIYLGGLDDVYMPAARTGVIVEGALSLYNVFAQDDIEVGTYMISFYCDGKYISAGTFGVTE